MPNPYQKLADHQYWRRAVANVEAHRFDPVVRTKFKIAETARVATAGSCFAQHISRKLQEIDFNYYIPEPGHHLSPEDRVRRNYGVFSARFGNLYTTAQLRQLFDEAFGRRTPMERHFRRADGRYVDPFRQQVEPEGYATPEAVHADRLSHLRAVRQMFESADVFVFTMGLTEAWRSKVDGSVLPTAPGVVGEAGDNGEYEFINYGVADVHGDMVAFLGALKKVNPKVRVVLTVSPVPLIATYEDQNVLVATTYSKAVLRVVAEMVVSAYDWVDYFPSFEIITGSYSGGLYYEDDFREVNALGVAHAMRCFLHNFVEVTKADAPPEALPPPVATVYDRNAVICDEEVLDAVRF